MFSTRMAPAPPTAASPSLWWAVLMAMSPHDGDEPARRMIEEQDEAIAAKSGRLRLSIKRVTRSER
jgi:hypothetical protein